MTDHAELARLAAAATTLQGWAQRPVYSEAQYDDKRSDEAQFHAAANPTAILALLARLALLEAVATARALDPFEPSTRMDLMDALEALDADKETT